MSRVRIFVDFWNFQLAWNDHVHPQASSPRNHVRIAWEVMPTTFMSELPAALGASAGQGFSFKGVNVYASVNPQPGSKDEKLRRFLGRTLAQMSGFTVHTVDRKERRHLDAQGTQQVRWVEKGVDTKLVTDLFAGAINDSYDVAMLVSNDADFVPAIQTIQERLNRQVVHVGFRRGGDEVRSACWSHILLDGDLADKLSD